MLESFFNNAAGLKFEILLKRDFTQVLSSEICKIFMNTFFYRRVPVKEFGTKEKVKEKVSAAAKIQKQPP